uniref:Uncharacterized protein n=1 Tax=Ciona intestinalis TaxID=7719 RepID=H2XXF8_CIOIN
MVTLSDPKFIIPSFFKIIFVFISFWLGIAQTKLKLSVLFLVMRTSPGTSYSRVSIS